MRETFHECVKKCLAEGEEPGVGNGALIIDSLAESMHLQVDCKDQLLQALADRTMGRVPPSANPIEQLNAIRIQQRQLQNEANTIKAQGGQTRKRALPEPAEPAGAPAAIISCEVCAKTFKTQKVCETHMASKAHQKAVKTRQNAVESALAKERLASLLRRREPPPAPPVLSVAERKVKRERVSAAFPPGVHLLE